MELSPIKLFLLLMAMVSGALLGPIFEPLPDLGDGHRKHQVEWSGLTTPRFDQGLEAAAANMLSRNIWGKVPANEQTTGKQWRLIGISGDEGRSVVLIEFNNSLFRYSQGEVLPDNATIKRIEGDRIEVENREGVSIHRLYQ